ncbi:hypothetical protein N4T77_17000 [Clostridium sp. CX1]|uniref:hypothetical protein n=1 Tax=Clostridium sp. CX1 TaxID=2978346 RepID=UPI0021C0BA2E|nr:hypothetical protein [Clostridium sp. CX1]MCT8978288.1 hypothetical protein [Clostridium sp. CX1]
MTTFEREELMYALAFNYLTEKMNDKVWQRERSQGYSMALGKLQGACMALKLDFSETENSVIVFTANREKLVTKVEI